MTNTFIDGLLDLWRNRDSPRDADFDPTLWQCMFQQLPTLLASMERWHELSAIVDEGFLERKLAELHDNSIVEADCELLFFAWARTEDIASATRFVLKRSRARHRAHILETEGVAEALLVAANQTKNAALLREILYWQYLLPTREKRLKVLLSLLQNKPREEWVAEILSAVAVSLPATGGTLSADLDLRKTLEAVLSLGANHIDFAIEVLWPQFSGNAAVGDLAAMPLGWADQRTGSEPRTVTDRLIAVLNEVPLEGRIFWLRELSALLNQLSFERQWAVRVCVAQAQCACGEYEAAQASLIEAQTALNDSLPMVTGKDDQEKFSRALTVVASYEAVMHAALLSLPEDLRKEAEEKINWNLYFPNPLSEPLYYFFALDRQTENSQPNMALVDECLARSCSTEATSLFALPLRYAARIYRRQHDQARAQLSMLLACRSLRLPGMPGELARAILRLAALAEELEPGKLGPALWKHAVHEIPRTADWQSSFDIHCDFASHAHRCGSASEAPRLFEKCIELANSGPLRGEPVLDRTEGEGRIGAVIKAFADAIENDVLLDYCGAFAELLPTKSVKHFLNTAVRAALRQADASLGQRWLTSLFALASDYSLGDELADSALRELADSPLPTSVLGSHATAALRRWTEDRGKWSEQFFLVTEKIAGREVAITLAERGSVDPSLRFSSLCIGQLARMGMGDLAASAAFSLLGKQAVTEPPKTLWQEMARAAHRLGIAEEVKYWIDQIPPNDSLARQLALAKCYLQIDDLDSAAQCIDELFEVLGTSQAEQHTRAIVDVIINVEASRNPARILDIFKRLSGSRTDIGTIGDLVIALSRAAETLDPQIAHGILTYCTNIAKQMPFAHDRASLGAVALASTAVVAVHERREAQADTSIDEALQILTDFYERPPVESADAGLAMRLTAMARGPFPRDEVLGTLDAALHQRKAARPEDFFFYMGLRECIRAAQTLAKAPEFLNRIRRLAKTPENRAYRVLLQHHLSVAFDKKHCLAEAGECFEEMTNTLTTFVDTPQMLTDLYAQVIEAFLRLRRSLPTEMSAPFSTEQLTHISNLVERNLDLLAPAQKQEICGRLLGFISRLPIPDLYVPLARLLSVVAVANPVSAREAYDAVRDAVC